MSKKVQIGSEVFLSMEAVKRRARSVVAEAGEGNRIPDEHMPFVMGLIDAHPRGRAKIAKGLESVRAKMHRGNLVLWLYFTDGTNDDFAWEKAIKGGVIA